MQLKYRSWIWTGLLLSGGLFAETTALTPKADAALSMNGVTVNGVTVNGIKLNGIKLDGTNFKPACPTFCNAVSGSTLRLEGSQLVLYLNP